LSKNLADKLGNICLIRGSYSDRIQTTVCSRNIENSDDIAETALEEKSAIISKKEIYKVEPGNPNKCGRCGKLGHHTQAFFIRKNP
jgi:hypothetical protein